MKAEYKTPTIEITKFHTEDIITTSSVGSEMSDAEIPSVLDADNIFNYD